MEKDSEGTSTFLCAWTDSSAGPGLWLPDPCQATCLAAICALLKLRCVWQKYRRSKVPPTNRALIPQNIKGRLLRLKNEFSLVNHHAVLKGRTSFRHLETSVRVCVLQFLTPGNNNCKMSASQHHSDLRMKRQFQKHVTSSLCKQMILRGNGWLTLTSVCFLLRCR